MFSLTWILPQPPRFVFRVANAEQATAWASALAPLLDNHAPPPLMATTPVHSAASYDQRQSTSRQYSLPLLPTEQPRRASQKSTHLETSPRSKPSLLQRSIRLLPRVRSERSFRSIPPTAQPLPGPIASPNPSYQSILPLTPIPSTLHSSRSSPALNKMCSPLPQRTLAHSFQEVSQARHFPLRPTSPCLRSGVSVPSLRPHAARSNLDLHASQSSLGRSDTSPSLSWNDLTVPITDLSTPTLHSSLIDPPASPGVPEKTSEG